MESAVNDGSCEYEVDCSGVCGGNLEIDCGGVCGGDNSTALNCCGLPFYNDCTSDCYENQNTGECCPIWDVDACGVCNGDGTSCLIVGDINDDGVLNVLDVITILQLIIAEDYNEVGDVNIDGILNILDLVVLINLIFDSK